jgi:hypothetical protein
MMRRGFVLIIIILVSSKGYASDLRGNLNISYQGSDGGSANPVSSTFSQVANLYITDRLFYSNDLTLGAFIFHTKSSGGARGDLRVRYSANLLGYKYSLYSSYSPYTLYRPGGIAQKMRVFQGSLTYRPRLLPDIMGSYASTRQYTTDKPRTQDGLNYTWNVGTQFFKSFGSFSGVYQRQQTKNDQPLIQTRQIAQSVNLGYDISKQYPANINWSAGYNYIGTTTENPGIEKDKSRTHIGSFQAGRNIGKWFSLSAATSGRIFDYEHLSQTTRIEDLLANGSASMRLRENVSLILLRGYNISQNKDDTTTKIVNDFVNLGSVWNFSVGHGAETRLALSRSLYYASIQGRNIVDNGTLIFDMNLYRRTSATLNLGVSRNQKTLSGFGRYQMTRNLDIISRPLRSMSLNMNYQSSETSNSINFKNSNSDNFSINLTQVLKYYFNYALTYARSAFRTQGPNTVSTISVALNYRLSNTLSLLGTYSRRDLGKSATTSGGRIDRTAGGRISWMTTSRSNLTLNYSISNINTTRQTQGFGGYYAMSF